jgi:hypothetical protein
LPPLYGKSVIRSMLNVEFCGTSGFVVVSDEHERSKEQTRSKR